MTWRAPPGWASAGGATLFRHQEHQGHEGTLRALPIPKTPPTSGARRAPLVFFVCFVSKKMGRLGSPSEEEGPFVLFVGFVVGAEGAFQAVGPFVRCADTSPPWGKAQRMRGASE